MYNSGLGAALAVTHFSPLSARPSAIFNFWHNISGPLLQRFGEESLINKFNEALWTCFPKGLFYCL